MYEFTVKVIISASKQRHHLSLASLLFLKFLFGECVIIWAFFHTFQLRLFLSFISEEKKTTTFFKCTCHCLVTVLLFYFLYFIITRDACRACFFWPSLIYTLWCSHIYIYTHTHTHKFQFPSSRKPALVFQKIL